MTQQRDCICTLKEETLINVRALSKVHPMPVDLCKAFNENALEKLTQSMFNNLTCYLLRLVDKSASSQLPWPLHNSKTEKEYRKKLLDILKDYSSKGLLSPFTSSYLVNLENYKVNVLMFQLTQLAVQQMLLSKMKTNSEKALYNEVTEKFNSSEGDNSFIEGIEDKTRIMSSKFENYLNKKKIIENMADNLPISQLGKANSWLKSDDFSNYTFKPNLDPEVKEEHLRLSKIENRSKLFDLWQAYLKAEIVELKSSWDSQMRPLLEECKKCQENTEKVIARQTGEVDRKTFTVEYNPKTEEICTRMLEEQANSNQKYILKNIVKDNKLNFPNLIRGCLISMCYVFQNIEIGDKIFTFYECLESHRQSYTEIISKMKILLARVLNAENRLETTPSISSQSISIRDSRVPSIHDLSDLMMNRDYNNQVSLSDTFSPWSPNKHQFNLQRKCTVNNSFIKPAPRSLLVTPFHKPPRISAYDCQNKMHNLSMISQITHKGNETIAECSTGYTKKQINQLLWTKKSSSSKKHKFKTDRPSMSIKEGGFCNEPTSIVLTRSQSSPNLFENREKRSLTTTATARRLSIMREERMSVLEVSGIIALEKDSHSTPQGVASLETSRKLMESSSLPHIIVTPTTDEHINKVLNEVDLNAETKDESAEMQPQPSHQKSTEEFGKSVEFAEPKSETPKTKPKVTGKTGSLEEIINRFKKLRTSNLPSDSKEDHTSGIRPILEAKENFNTVKVDDINANRILLPDLVSPSCSIISTSNNYMEQLCFDDDENPMKARESLGTALGVDNTFLDQFDLID